MKSDDSPFRLVRELVSVCYSSSESASASDSAQVILLVLYLPLVLVLVRNRSVEHPVKSDDSPFRLVRELVSVCYSSLESASASDSAQVILLVL